MIARPGAALAVVRFAHAGSLAAQDSLPTDWSRVYAADRSVWKRQCRWQVDYEGSGSAPVENGFGVTDFRLKLAGELDGGFGQALQANVATAPAILGAALHQQVTHGMILKVGQFKALQSGAADRGGRPGFHRSLARGQRSGPESPAWRRGRRAVRCGPAGIRRRCLQWRWHRVPRQR